MSKDRLTAFTDAVLAIVMTLLVIEIEQPEDATWQAILDMRQSYLSYAVTFIWLATMWNNHHHMVRPAKMALDLAIKGLGMLIAIFGYPPAVTVSMLIAMLLYLVPERHAESRLSPSVG